MRGKNDRKVELIKWGIKFDEVLFKCIFVGTVQLISYAMYHMDILIHG
jgi:hypothetical protein